jgi:hypothetical protein
VGRSCIDAFARASRDRDVIVSGCVACRRRRWPGAGKPRPAACEPMCAMIGFDLPATCRLVADFSRTRFEYLDEHLLALIAGHMQQRNKNQQINHLQG